MGDKWAHVFADPCSREIQISDEEIIPNGVKGQYPNGVWLGGKKFTLVREQVLEIEGNEVKTIFGSRSDGGVYIGCSAQSVVVGFNDKKAKGQEAGNCQKAVCAMIGYLYGTEG